MKRRKHSLAIDATTFIIHKVHEIWVDKQIAYTLLIDIKKTFDYIS